MPHGPIPLRMHAAVEPIAGVILILAPWIFGFSDVGSSTSVSIAAGVAVLLSGASTRWPWSLVELVPLRAHFMLDLALSVVLIVAPFVFGDSDRGDATRFLVIVGVLELLTALGTNWDAREEIRADRSEATARAAY